MATDARPVSDRAMSFSGPRTTAAPTLRTERRLLRAAGGLLAACDEVGRGALGGPVTVGLVLVDAASRSAPAGVRDSKLLSPAAREKLVPRIRRWALGYSVGHASSDEIDLHGIIGALRLAGHRALVKLPERPDLVLLDGNHDWFSLPHQVGLYDDEAPLPDVIPPPVTTLIKADMTCSSVAAASVLAKTERDAIMVELATRFPAYGWEVNKGYATPTHLAALRRWGPCVEHRESWRLPLRDDALALVGATLANAAPLGAALVGATLDD